MKLPARVGMYAIASILACGALPAAHATGEPDIERSQNDNAPSSSLAMPCNFTMRSTTASIDFPAEIPFDELTVSLNGKPTPPLDVTGGSVVIDSPKAGATVQVELWQEKSLTGECTTSVPATEEPSPTTTQEPTGTQEPTDTQTPPASPEPLPSETETESETPDPPPTTPTTTPSSSSSAGSTESSTLPPSSTTTPPSGSPSSAFPQDPGSTDRPTSTFTPEQPPVTQGARDIRQFSDHQRYLLPRLLGIESRPGSSLIMPRPRNADQGGPQLETLPPVSEDELEAIKARLNAPDRADRPPHQDLAAMDIEQQLAKKNTGWLLPSLIGVGAIAGVILWLFKRRKPHH